LPWIINPFTCKILSSLSPSIFPWLWFSSKSFPSPSPHYLLFTFKNHFHEKLKKVKSFNQLS
jgi:hypothetical protein